jgi:hypothetical protein
VGDEVLLNDEGEVQIFTLKMTSNKTALIGGYNDKDFGVSRNAEGKTLTALNAGLEAHYNTSGWLTHLVSVDLVAYPYVFTSSSSKESSMGIRFGLEGNARPLSQASQELAFNVCTNPKFQVKFSDPFGLNQKDSADRAVPISEDDIPF